MSTLAFSGDYSGELFPARRYPAHRLPMTEQIVFAPVDLVPLVVPSTNQAFVNTRRTAPVMIAAAILATHLAGAWYYHTHPNVKTVLEDAPPITVELYKPIVEPPKLLPEKKELPPPPVKAKEPPLPAVKLPDPLPPSPVVNEPVASTIPAVQAPPAPEPAPVAPPEPVEPIIQASAKAGYLHNPPPVYPDFAQEQGWEGQVILKVHVQPNGKPSTVQIKRSSGRKMLDQSALEAVQRWSFAPAKRGQTAIDGWVDVPIDFKISS